MIFPMLAIGLLMYVMLIRPQRREKQTREAMVSALKKNDHVVTVSGIYGVVTNVRPEADEVTVRVDDTSNTRLRMTMSSILRVLGDEPTSDKTSSS
jgi:preprotein translocase subunit YajC